MIAAVGEVNAARALKEASESIAASPTAMQLRYLQTLNIIAAERGSTIIFPIPINMLGPMVCVCDCVWVWVGEQAVLIVSSLPHLQIEI